MKANYAKLDWMKLLCAFMVIGIHTNPFQEISEVYNYIFSNVICRIAVPIFAVASSFLFYMKEDDTFIKLAKFEKHILKIYIVWSIIYFPLTLIINSGVMDWKNYFKDFFWNGSFSHLWYLPGIALAMLFVNFGLGILSDKVIFLICLLLYMIGACGDTYSYCADGLFYEMLKPYMNIMITTRNGIFFLPIWVMFGKIISEYKKADLKIPGCTTMSTGILCAIFVLEGIWNIDKSHVDTNYYFSLLLLVPVLFIKLVDIVQTTGTITERYSPCARKVSMLVYYSHYFILYTINYAFRNIGYEYQKHNGIVFILAILISVLSSCLLIIIDKKTKWGILKVLC